MGTNESLSHSSIKIWTSQTAGSLTFNNWSCYAQTARLKDPMYLNSLTVVPWIDSICSKQTGTLCIL